MNIKLKAGIPTVPYLIISTVAYLSVILLLSLLGWFGAFAVPSVGALLAIMYLHDTTPHRVLSVITSVLALIPEILFGSYSVNGVFTVLFAIVLTVCSAHKISKAETAVYITGLGILLAVLTAYLTAVYYNGSWSLGMAFDTVTNKLSEIKNALISFDPFEYLSSMMPQGSEEQIFVEPTPEYFYYYRKTVELYCGLGFGAALAVIYFLSALSVKTVYFLLGKLCTASVYFEIDPGEFKLSKLTAGIFLAVMIMSLFAVGIDATPFELTIGNLNLALILPFIYLGLKILYRMLSMRFGKGASIAGVLLILYFMSGTVYYILAAMGAISCFISRKTVTDRKST